MMRVQVPTRTTRTVIEAGNGGSRRRFLNAGVVLLSGLLGLGPLAVHAAKVAASRGSRPRVAQAGAADAPTRTVMGAAYVQLSPWAAGYGLKSVWIEKGRRLRLESAYTKILVEVDRREVIINDLRVFLGEPIVVVDGSLWIGVLDARDLLGPVLRPAGIGIPVRPLKTICLDAGHGGNDTGTQNKALKLDEKRMALDVAHRVKRLLEGQGYKVVMTRSDDRFIELEQRAEIANRTKADLFVSIHFNSFSQAAITGTETYILTRRTQRSSGASKREDSDKVALPGNAMDPWNTVLGYAMHRQMINKLETFDRGLKAARFKVLTLVDCPAVLVEAGYLSNEREARKIGTRHYRSEIAEGIVNGISSYAAKLDAVRKK